MGFVFPQNFNSPYRATGFRDFWRRWHMTLSRFLRDFLYIPLGRQPGRAAIHLPQPDDHDGARRAVARRRVDVRALGRLPRGLAWSPSTRWAGRIRSPGWLRWLVTFHLVVLGWVLFRPQGIGIGGTFLARLGSPGARRRSGRVPVLLAVALVDRAAVPAGAPGRALQARLGRLNPAVLGPALAILILFVAATVPSQGVPPFIYFRF